MSCFVRFGGATKHPKQILRREDDTVKPRWKNRLPHLVAWGIAVLLGLVLVVQTQYAVALHNAETSFSRQYEEEQWLWGQASAGLLLLFVLAALFSWQRMREQASHRALAQTKAQMDLALEGGGLGLWTWDLVTGEFEPDNRMWGILGYIPGELPTGTQTFRDMLHPDDATLVQQALVPVLKGESARLLLPHRLRHKDGHWIWLMARGQVVSRDEKGKFALGLPTFAPPGVVAKHDRPGACRTVPVPGTP